MIEHTDTVDVDSISVEITRSGKTFAERIRRTREKNEIRRESTRIARYEYRRRIALEKTSRKAKEEVCVVPGGGGPPPACCVVLAAKALQAPVPRHMCHSC